MSNDNTQTNSINMNLHQATILVEEFLDNPTKKQPLVLRIAINVWAKEYGAYISSVNESTPARVGMNIDRLMKMQVKALGIVFAMEGTSTILSELIPHANSITLNNAGKIAAVLDQMLKHLYQLPLGNAKSEIA